MQLPTQIGPFAVEARLGQGGMGVVFRARDPALGRGLAVKVLAADALLSPAARVRFQREAEALARVPHPHVVGVHAVGEDDGRPWIALDLVEGESLGDRIRRGPLEPEEAARIAADLAGALAHVHQAGILHRDLKPDNVLLDAEGRARLTDFGLARRLDGELTRLSQSGSVAGTPGFMAPEQVRGERDLDPSVDVYGMGGLLYAMLTGAAPFSGSPLELIVATLEAPPEPPSRRRPGVPRALDAICLRCLGKRPRDRYTAAALEHDLRRYLAGSWRPQRPAWAAPAALVLALVGATLAWRAARAPAPAPTPAGAAASPAAAADPDLADPSAALRRLRQLPAAEALPALDAWLRAHPDHPQAGEARAWRARLRERPLWGGRLAQALRRPPSRETRLAWWGDDRLVVWLTYGPGLEVWSVPERRALQQVPTPAALRTVLALDDRTLLLGLGDGSLCWFTDGALARRVPAFVPADDTSGRGWGVSIEDLRLDAGSGAVWAASQSGWIRAFDLATGALVGELHHGEPVRCLLPLDARRLISAAGLSTSLKVRAAVDPSATNSLRVWDLEAAAATQTIALGWSPWGLARAGDLVLLANVNSEVRLFRLADDGALHPQGYLAGGGLPPPEDDFLEGRLAVRGQLQGLTVAGGLAWAAGGDPSGGELRAWRLPDGVEVLRWQTRVHATSIALRAGHLALGLADGELELYRAPGSP